MGFVNVQYFPPFYTTFTLTCRGSHYSNSPVPGPYSLHVLFPTCPPLHVLGVGHIPFWNTTNSPFIPCSQGPFHDNAPATLPPFIPWIIFFPPPLLVDKYCRRGPELRCTFGFPSPVPPFSFLFVFPLRTLQFNTSDYFKIRPDPMAFSEVPL